MSDEVEPSRPPEPVIEYSNGLAAGAPRRWKFTPVWPVVLAGVTTAFVAGGGMLTLVSVTCTPLNGAMRSTRIQWEERSAEVEQAAAFQPPGAKHD